MAGSMGKALYDDGPFYTVAAEAEAQVLQGNVVYQKWSCQFCGERVTMSQPNAFTTKGIHEGCPVDPDGETDIKAQGCNYLLIQAGSKIGQDYLSDLGSL